MVRVQSDSVRKRTRKYTNALKANAHSWNNGSGSQKTKEEQGEARSYGTKPIKWTNCVVQERERKAESSRNEKANETQLITA